MSGEGGIYVSDAEFASWQREAQEERRNGRQPPPTRRLTLTASSGITSGRVHWLWEDWIPLRSVAVVAGEPGLGKSILTGACLPSAVTRGTLEGELRGQPADVAIVSAEDDWSTVIVPRLMAAGADLKRVHRVDVEDESQAALLTLPADVPRLAGALEELRRSGRTVGMVVIDPINAFLSEGTDSHKDASVRRALAPLARLAMDAGLVVLVVAHLNKNDSARLMSRVSGSVAFGAAARTVIGFARDPDDPEGEQGRERVLVHGKSNWGRYATSLAARIESRDVLTDDGVADTGLLVITGESSIGVDDLQRDREERSAGEEAAAFLVEVLAGGPVAAVDVKREADECGIAERTLARAKRDLKVRSIKGGLKSGWTWELPPKDAKNAEGCHVQDTASFGNVGILRDATEDEEAELERIQTSTAQGWIGGGQGVSPYRERPLDPPSATVEEEAELERLRDKFPELEELAQRCRCDSPVVGVDDDGDPVCAKCGRAS